MEQVAQRATAAHLAWVDVARIVAVLAVITIHVTSYPFAAGDRLNAGAWIVTDIAYSATRWPVTLLVMIAGFLALDRDEEPLGFYRRRARRILVPLVAWSIIYWAYLETGSPAGRGLTWFVTASINGGTYFHLYFLFVVAGLAAVTPMLRPVVARGGTLIRIAVALGISYAITQRLLLEFGLASGSNAVSMFIPYIGFFLAGSLLGRLDPSPRIVLVASIALLVAIAGASLAVYLLNAGADGRWVAWVEAYFGLAAVVEALAVFTIVRAIRSNWATLPLVRWVGSLTFGVYLIHPMVADLLGPIVAFPRGPGSAVLYIGVRVVVYGAVSAVIVAGMRRLPLVRSIV